MDVVNITYKGKQYPVRISYYALKMLRSETGKNIEDAHKDMALYEALLYYALVAGHNYTGKELDIKKEDMVWMLDVCFDQFVAALQHFFPPPADAGDDDGTKKKMKARSTS